MKRINNLTVKVTYTVSLSDIDVSDEVLKSMNAIFDDGGEVDVDSAYHYAASDWLSGKINERDAYEWTTTIEDID